jgi:hypothetical protein
MVRDLLPLPDEAAMLLPALVGSLAEFPPDEQLGRARAALIMLSRQNGLWGATEVSNTCDTTGQVVSWCLRILLTVHSTKQSASTAWADLIDRTRGLEEFPAASPPRPRPDPQRSPSPAPPPATSPTNITVSDMTGLLRALSSASSQESALNELISEMRQNRAPTRDQTICGTNYCIHRDDPMAPQLHAALHNVEHYAQELEQGRLPPKPFSIAAVSSVAFMPRHAALLFLAEEWLGMTEPNVAEAIRLARLTRPTSSFEADAWRRGTTVHAGFPAAAVTQKTARICRICHKHVPTGIAFSDHQKSSFCRAPQPKNGRAPAPPRAGLPRH